MLSSFILESTEYTPNVSFDVESGLFELSGRSLAEDTVAFYEPLHEWILEYIQNPRPTTELNIHLDYFSSASTKQLVDLLNKFEKINESPEYTVYVNWGYDKNDETMRTRGEEIASVVNLPFTYRAY